MKILVFTEGTILMHSAAVGKTREERVAQVINEDESVHRFADYVPNDDCLTKLWEWKNQGAEIWYLTSREDPREVQVIQQILIKNQFPDYLNLVIRHDGESYADVAARVMPDVLIEDDCESIGGEIEMTYPHIKEDIKAKIKSIVVKEFGGIDHLPDNINNLLTQ